MATNVTSIMGKGEEGERGDYTGEDIPEHTRIIFILVGSIFTVCGVVGNILIITTILVTKTMRNPHFYFIVNLAVSDILITGYVIPNLVISLIQGYYPVTDFNHCIFNGFVIVIAYVSSLLSLTVISVNRYLSVCHNQLFSRIFSNKILSSIIGCAVIWLMAFLSTLPCLVGWGRFTYDTKTHYCGYDRAYSFSYTLFLMVFSIGIPVAVVFACNFAMWRYVRHSSHRIYAMTHENKRGKNAATDNIKQQQQVTPKDDNDNDKNKNNNEKVIVINEHHTASGSSGNRRSKAEFRKTLESAKSSGVLVTPGELALIKTIFVIFITFAVFMTPYMMSTLLDSDDQWSSMAHLICSFTSFTNSCLNCVLYGIMTPAFKKAYRKLFTQCCAHASTTIPMAASG